MVKEKDEHGYAVFNFDGGWTFRGYLINKVAQGYGTLEKKKKDGSIQTYEGCWDDSFLKIKSATNKNHWDLVFIVAKERDHK